MYKVLVTGFVLLLTAVNVWVFFKLVQPEIQSASDRICVPLYNETGYECCQ
jgi:hypothetical protein